MIRLPPCIPLLCLALALPGCRGDSTSTESVTPAEPTTPVDGGTLVVAIPGDPETLNPLLVRSMLDAQLSELLFPYLVRYDFDCEVVPRPALAETWTWSEDGLTLTFELRSGATWSDGQPLDTSDVLFTFDLRRDPAVGSPYSRNLEALRLDDPVEVVDERTVRVHFAAPGNRTTRLNQVTGLPLVPEHVLADTPRDELARAAFSTLPVTAGPFALDRWKHNQELVLVREAHPPYGEPAHVQRVHFKILPEYSTRVMELTSGQVDMLPSVELEDVVGLRQSRPRMAFHSQGMRSLEYIAWNLTDERFADPAVRTALAHAVDADALIAALLRAGEATHGQRSIGSITPELCASRNPDVEPLGHDLDRARSLLAGAGWSDADGDGLLERDGEPFRFTLLTGAGNERRALTQLILQEQFRAVGVAVDLEVLERGEFHGRLASRDFEAVLLGWGAQLFADPSDLWHSQSPMFNVSSYVNAAVDRLIDEGLATSDPAEAARCWRELQALVYADQPCCFLFWREDLVALSARVEGAHVNVLGPFNRLEQWWLSP